MKLKPIQPAFVVSSRSRPIYRWLWKDARDVLCIVSYCTISQGFFCSFVEVKQKHVCRNLVPLYGNHCQLFPESYFRHYFVTASIDIQLAQRYRLYYQNFICSVILSILIITVRATVIACFCNCPTVPSNSFNPTFVVLLPLRRLLWESNGRRSGAPSGRNSRWGIDVGPGVADLQWCFFWHYHWHHITRRFGSRDHWSLVLTIA